MNLPMRLLRVIAQEADSDSFYKAAKTFGERAARALGEKKRSQLTGLESLASSSLKVSDVFDYIKLRTARQAEWRQDSLGPDLLKHLEDNLRRAQDRVCRDEQAKDLSDVAKQEVYRRLIQAFIAHLVAQYEFTTKVDEGEPHARR